ncbi:hypothetical protein WA026_005669 [Henosepilachna vigintioctopunctata]|uniref:Proton-coupled folate transporter n=1 Tax=Henosepilachna vigintioctopunctata TaxID=420089 RepID=A0AAW1TX41_9CUCU
MEQSNLTLTNEVRIQNSKNTKKHTKLSVFERLKSLAATITVEPLMLFFITSSMMATLTTENLNLEKACRVNIGFNASVCDAMVIRDRSRYTPEQEIQVQKLVSSMLVYKTAAQGIIPFLLMLFLGSWSDRHRRRKPFILMPIYGDIVSSLGYILCTYFFTQLSVEYAIFFEAIPVSVTGGWFCFFVGVYSYVTEKSSEETRTMRIGTATMFTHVSLTMGIALSGITYRKLGFYGVYSLSLFMFVAAIFYGIIMIEDDLSSKNSNGKNGTKMEPKKSFLVDLFDYRHIVNTFAIVFKEGAFTKRLKLCLVMILVLLNVGSYRGELTVMYMFSRRKFTWDELDYSGYNTYHSVTQMLGASLCLAIFVNWMKVDDATLGMIGMSSKIVGCFASALAPTPLYFYLAALTEIFNGSSHIAMRSIMSKLVSADELGKMFSIFGLCEALTPLLCGPLYSFVYHQTIDVFPGAFYFVSALLHTGALFIFLWLYLLRKPSRKCKEEKEMEVYTEQNEMFFDEKC